MTVPVGDPPVQDPPEIPVQIPGRGRITIIETVQRVAPLGLRFWDAATNSFVGSGLVVTAYAVGQEQRQVTATVNPGGIYGFVHLPGLRDLENGAGDDAYWAAAPAHARQFRIDVVDLEGRFLPCSLTATAPAKGIVGLTCGSPPLPFTLASPVSPVSPHAPTVEVVPLFSAPNRPLPAGMAVMRAHLYDSAGAREAAWALVEAFPPGQPPARGIADEKGTLTLIFPYPMPHSPLLFSPPLASPESPPVAARRALWQQSWTIALAAFYGALPVPYPAPQQTAKGVLNVPELCDILAQPPATLWYSQSPDQVLAEATLRYGQEVNLHSAGGAVPASSLPITTGAPP